MGQDRGWYPVRGRSGGPIYRGFARFAHFLRERACAHATILKWVRGCQPLAGPGGSVSTHFRKRRSSFFLSHRADPPGAAPSLFQRPKDQIKLYHELRGINSVITRAIRYGQCARQTLMLPASSRLGLLLMPTHPKQVFGGVVS